MTQIAISHVGSVAFSTESGRGVAIVVCIAMSGRELASTAMLAHTQLWQLLSLFSQNCVPTCGMNISKAFWVAFFANFGL